MFCVFKNFNQSAPKVRGGRQRRGKEEGERRREVRSIS